MGTQTVANAAGGGVPGDGGGRAVALRSGRHGAAPHRADLRARRAARPVRRALRLRHGTVPARGPPARGLRGAVRNVVPRLRHERAGDSARDVVAGEERQGGRGLRGGGS